MRKQSLEPHGYASLMWSVSRPSPAGAAWRRAGLPPPSLSWEEDGRRPPGSSGKVPGTVLPDALCFASGERMSTDHCGWGTEPPDKTKPRSIPKLEGGQSTSTSTLAATDRQQYFSAHARGHSGPRRPNLAGHSGPRKYLPILLAYI